MGNIPDEAALRSAEKINKMVSGLGEEDILLVLISGKYRDTCDTSFPG